LAATRWLGLPAKNWLGVARQPRLPFFFFLIQKLLFEVFNLYIFLKEMTKIIIHLVFHSSLYNKMSEIIIKFV
jgi:hypothetical protein